MLVCISLIYWSLLIIVTPSNNVDFAEIMWYKGKHENGYWKKCI